MKTYDKQRLFEVMEMINPEMDNSWAIFKISNGEKCFATSIENESIHICDSGVKYSDPTVLKFPLERAKELVDKNSNFYDTLGIVNSKGVQLKRGKFDNVWGK